MSSVDVDNLRAVDPEGIELVPAAQVGLKHAPSLAISLGELRDFAIARYRQQLAAIGSPKGDADADRDERKDRDKVNQYSSAAFTSVAKRSGGWDVHAKLAIEAALVEANKLANNRKPRAELNRALNHLKQLEKKEAGVAERSHTGRNTKKELGPFAQLLSASIKRKGVSITALAAKFKITYLKLWKWANGDDQPSAETEKLVKAMGAYLDLDANELWELRTLKKKAAIISKAHNELPNKPERKKKHRLSRDMDKWPPQLAAELSAMLAVKRNRSEPTLTR
jgi:ribosome-binding protein aMBF1 (putative translation factor)